MRCTLTQNCEYLIDLTDMIPSPFVVAGITTFLKKGNTMCGTKSLETLHAVIAGPMYSGAVQKDISSLSM